MRRRGSWDWRSGSGDRRLAITNASSYIVGMAMASRTPVTGMSMVDRLNVVVGKASALLPGAVGRHLLDIVSPSSLAFMAGVVVAWAAAHFVGVGEVADVVLLAAGWLAIGGSALSGGRKLVAFAIDTQAATSPTDLDRAARELADAIIILGIDVVLAMLLHSKPKTTFAEPFRPDIKMPTYRQFASAMPKAGPTRMYEARLIFTRARDAGRGGTRTGDNLATIGRRYYPDTRSSVDAFKDVARTIYHERVHQRLTQAFSLLGRPALYMKLGAYKRSYILRYLEEAAAESYALYKTGGVRPGELTGLRFPLNGHYGVTLARIGQEAGGLVLGPVVVGQSILWASYGIVHDQR